MLSRTIEQTALTKLIWVVIALVCALFIGSVGAKMQLPVLAVIIIFFVTLSISFVRGTDGLYILIFAMLFSPEISSGITASSKAGEIRRSASPRKMIRTSKATPGTTEPRANTLQS